MHLYPMNLNNYRPNPIQQLGDPFVDKHRPCSVNQMLQNLLFRMSCRQAKFPNSGLIHNRICQS